MSIGNGTHFKGQVVSRGHLRVWLSPKEAQMLELLGGGVFTLNEHIYDALWPDYEQTPDWFLNLVRLYMYHLRKKLKPFGWVIKNRMSMGYYLEEIEEVSPFTMHHCRMISRARSSNTRYVNLGD